MAEKKEIEKWLDLVKRGKAFCYIKPTRYVHDSGFRCFELGYCTIDDNAKVKDKYVLGSSTDHIWTRRRLNEVEEFNLNLDLTRDGHIRLWEMDSDDYVITWDLDDFTISTMGFKHLSRIRNDNQPTK